MGTVTELEVGLDVVPMTDPGTTCFTKKKEKRLKEAMNQLKKDSNSVKRYRIYICRREGCIKASNHAEMDDGKLTKVTASRNTQKKNLLALIVEQRRLGGETPFS